MNFSKILNEAKAKTNINISTRLFRQPGFGREVIAGVKQKTADSDQMIFKANSYDIKEFGKNVYRISTPLSKPDSADHRSIVKIEIKNNVAKMRLIDNDVYEETMKVKWLRPLKLEWLTIDANNVNDFDVDQDNVNRY